MKFIPYWTVVKVLHKLTQLIQKIIAQGAFPGKQLLCGLPNVMHATSGELRLQAQAV